MSPRKENSGGKKFQSRMPDEKRSRVSPKKSDKPAKRKFIDKNSGSTEFPKKEGRSFGPKKTYTKTDRPYGEKRTADRPYKKDFSGDKKDRPYGEFKGGTGDNRRSGGTPRGPVSRGPGARGPAKKYGSTGDSRDKFGPKKEYKKFGDKSTAPQSDRPGSKKRFDPREKPQERGRKFPDKREARPQNFKGGRKNYNRAAEDLHTGQTLIEDDEVRLNRYIANSGLCSRREADVMISQGLVTINGLVVETLGVKVKKGDDVRVDGKRINPEKAVYILLNKPKGYITSTSDPDERATVMELIDLPGKERIYPVGRLDRNTTGVLLLTNDGELAQKLMHPSFEIKKIYKAGLDRKPSKEHMLAWVNGVELEDGYMAFEQIGFVDEEDDSVVGLEVHSGRNRIVRRMFEHFDYEVKSLDRVMLGEFDHVKLGRGKWRFLNDKEIRYVEKLKRMKGKSRR